MKSCGFRESETRCGMLQSFLSVYGICERTNGGLELEDVVIRGENERILYCGLKMDPFNAVVGGNIDAVKFLDCHAMTKRNLSDSLFDEGIFFLVNIREPDNAADHPKSKECMLVVRQVNLDSVVKWIRREGFKHIICAPQGSGRCLVSIPAQVPIQPFAWPDSSWRGLVRCLHQHLETEGWKKFRVLKVPIPPAIKA